MDIATAGPRLDRVFQVHVLENCEKLARKSELLFIVAFVTMSIALSTVAELGLSAAGLGIYEVPELLTRGIPTLVFITVVLAPLFETLFLQQLPMTLAKRFGMSGGMQFVLGSVPFAILHFDMGLVSGVSAGVVGGVILSLAYLTFLPQSKSKAFVITAAVHALHNLASALMIASEMT